VLAVLQHLPRPVNLPQPARLGVGVLILQSGPLFAMRTIHSRQLSAKLRGCGLCRLGVASRLRQEVISLARRVLEDFRSAQGDTQLLARERQALFIVTLLCRRAEIGFQRGSRGSRLRINVTQFAVKFKPLHGSLAG